MESVEALTSEEDSIPPVKRRRPSIPTPAVTLQPPLLKQIETSPEEASNGSKETRLLKSPSLKATLSERALNLLKKGCLPLFPPSRRDWGEEEVTLTVGNSSITWSPKDWESLTPDRRLLSWEFCAMSIQQSMDPTAATVIERTDLLDKFNFLALPGTIEKPVKMNNQIKRKTRYYISEQLKYMVQDNTGDETWLHIMFILLIVKIRRILKLRWGECNTTVELLFIAYQF